MRLPAATKDRDDNKADRSKRSSISSDSLESYWERQCFVPSNELKEFVVRYGFTFNTWHGKLFDKEWFSPLQRACHEACKNTLARQPELTTLIEELIETNIPADFDERTPDWGKPPGWAAVHFLAETVDGLPLLQRLAEQGACIYATVEGIFLIHIYIYIYIFKSYYVALYIISYHMNTPTYYKIGPTNIAKEVGLICPTHLSPASTQPHSLAPFNTH